MFYIHDGVIKGAFTLCGTWMEGKPEMRPGIESAMTKQHYHDSSEYIGFIGYDYKNPHELGAEIEFWYEDEKYIINKSCVLYIPAMLHHGPMKYLKIDSPFFIFSTLSGVHHEVHMVDHPILGKSK